MSPAEPSRLNLSFPFSPSAFCVYPLSFFLYSQIAVRKEHETAQMFLRSGPSGLQLLRTSMTCLFHRHMQAHGGLGLVMNTACLLEHHRDRQQYHGHNPCGLNRKTSLKRFFPSQEHHPDSCREQNGRRGIRSLPLSVPCIIPLNTKTMDSKKHNSQTACPSQNHEFSTVPQH